MRFRTATILSVVLVVGILALRSAAYHLAVFYVEQGNKEIPSYTRIFFIVTAFFWSYGWLLIPAIVSILFTTAIFKSQAQPRR